VTSTPFELQVAAAAAANASPAIPSYPDTPERGHTEDLTAARPHDLSPRTGGELLARADGLTPRRILYGLLACWILAAAGLGPASCAPAALRPSSLAPKADWTVLTVTAAWRDVEPALEVAVRRSELTVVDREVGDLEMAFDLQSVAEEPGRLVAIRRSSADPRTPEPIRLEARVGLFGNSNREQALLRALAARLEQLRGREWAPAR
jgi:hypothetical protein